MKLPVLFMIGAFAAIAQQPQIHYEISFPNAAHHEEKNAPEYP